METPKRQSDCGVTDLETGETYLLTGLFIFTQKKIAKDIRQIRVK